MTGRNKKITVGFRYSLGMHAVLCQTPIDGLLQLDFQDRKAWSGKALNQRIAVYKNNLFGGEGREGGVSGFIDVEGGAATQGVNDYLDAKLTGSVPAFRGVVSMVFRRFYFGNNPYLKPWRAKVQNVFSTFQGWLPELAPINPEASFDRTALYIAIDDSGSMSSRLATMKTAVNQLLDEIPNSTKIAVRIVKWGGAEDASSQTFGFDSTSRATLKAFVNGFTASSAATDFETAFLSAGAFFTNADNNITLDSAEAEPFVGASSGGGDTGDSDSGDNLNRIIIFITDGEPTRVGNPPTQTIVDDALAVINAISPAPEIFGINIDLTDTQWTVQVDSDGYVPVVSNGEEESFASVLSASFSSFCDINPAHILRDVLISPTNDGPGVASQIGDTFATAAQTLLDEGFGLSFFWRNPSDRDSFKQTIESHINGVAYFDTTTGKWELKLIRPDYTVGDLFTFESTNIVAWPEPPEVALGQELTNQITLEYTRRDNGKTGSVTLTNIAGVQETGRIVAESVKMPGITWPALANKVAQRELEARGKPLQKGAFRAAYIPAGVNLGSAIIVNEPRLGLVDKVCRVTELEETDGRDNSVLVRFVEDVWATDPAEASFAELEDFIVEDFTALAPNVNFAIELPFYQNVQIFGQSEVEALLVDDSDAGYWAATCDQPNDNHVQAVLAVLEGATYVQATATPFAPTWVLTANMDSQASTTTFTATLTNDEDQAAVGDLIQIDDEIMRVDSIAISGTTVTFTVGRGCLDTVPRLHPEGSYAILWPDFVGTDLVAYTLGETTTLKILPATKSETLSLDGVSAQTVTYASRMNRPYPVGNFMIESSYAPAGLLAGVVTGTWAHRDRTFQTTATVEDHTDGSVGPEAGVIYVPVAREIRIWADVFESGEVDFFARVDFFADDTPDKTIEYDLSPDQALTFDFDLDDIGAYFDDRTLAVELGVITRRGSPAFENWQTPLIRINPLLAPINLTGEDV